MSESNKKKNYFSSTYTLEELFFKLAYFEKIISNYAFLTANLLILLSITMLVVGCIIKTLYYILNKE